MNRIVRGAVTFLTVLAIVGFGSVAAILTSGALATALIATRVESLYPPVGRMVEVTGGRLSLIEAGPERAARATVVLLHGASATASDPMEGFGRALAAKGFRVLAFDRPGFGWSDRLAGREAASPAIQARAIGEALDRLRVGPAIVFGHSWAGALALRIALDRPDRVAGLLLAAPVALPFADRPTPWWLKAAVTPPLDRLLVRTIGVPLGLYYLPQAARSVFRPEEMVEDYVERSRAPLILRPAAALSNFQDLLGLPAALKDQAPRYGEIHVPVVIVAGEADQVVRSDAQAVPLSARIPGANLVTLPGIGHMLHFTAANRLVSETESLQGRIDVQSPG